MSDIRDPSVVVAGCCPPRPAAFALPTLLLAVALLSPLVPAARGAASKAANAAARPDARAAARSSPAAAPSGAATGTPRQALPPLAPPSAFRARFEDVEGAVLLEASLISDVADTSGLLVLDTGAGFLGLDGPLVERLGLADSSPTPMTLVPRPLSRLSIGSLAQDQVGPVLSIDTEVIHRAIDRPVLGLLGQKPLASFAVRLDYQLDSLALVPVPQDGLVAANPRSSMAMHMAAARAGNLMAMRASREALGGLLTEDAIGLPFELEGDGKIVMTGYLLESPSARGPALQFVLDTGATKTVLFPRAIEAGATHSSWPELRGLSAPTLYGSEETYLTRIPVTALGTGETRAVAREIDAAVIGGPLEGALTEAIGRPIDGLLGHSFLRRFRVTIDYPHHVLWLEPLDVPSDERPHEYSHVGVQVERRDGAVRVVAVARGSPAEAAKIVAGDELLEIDGTPAAGSDILALTRLLEGPPGTRVRLRLRRDGAEISLTVTRRQLL